MSGIDGVGSNVGSFVSSCRFLGMVSAGADDGVGSNVGSFVSSCRLWCPSVCRLWSKTRTSGWLGKSDGSNVGLFVSVSVLTVRFDAVVEAFVVADGVGLCRRRFVSRDSQCR